MMPTDDPRVFVGGEHGFSRGPSIFGGNSSPSSNTKMLMVANGITGAIPEDFFQPMNQPMCQFSSLMPHPKMIYR